jgi:hypothetical protein
MRPGETLLTVIPVPASGKANATASLGRVDSPKHADARRRHRTDEGCLAPWKKIDSVKLRAHPEQIFLEAS